MKQKLLLPGNNWKKIRYLIKSAGEGSLVSNIENLADIRFLENIGVLDANMTGCLTPAGVAFFEAAFFRVEEDVEMEILRTKLLDFMPTLVLQQNLWGVKKISLEQVITVLRSKGFLRGEGGESITHFLDLLNYVGIIKYKRKEREIIILISPDGNVVPRCVYLDPARPFSNQVWIKRIIGECVNFIYWFDKHFQKEALEWIWSVADANNVSEIVIISLDMGEKNISKDAKKMYKKLKIELGEKGIMLTWMKIDSKQVSESHDRWIIGGNGYARNIPDVNSISSGKKAEMILSDNYPEILESFKKYRKLATEI